MGLAAIAEDRCTRCSRTDERRELLRDGVVEAARQVVAWYLREERTLPEHMRTIQTTETIEAIQGLRDACAAERASR